MFYSKTGQQTFTESSPTRENTSLDEEAIQSDEEYSQTASETASQQE